MYTIFTVPKPFIGNFDIIQRNAIESWLLLDSHYEIILFGDERGTKEVARDFGVKYIPDVVRNEYGTPMLDSVFAKAQQLAKYERMCFINTDIILMKDFLTAIKRISFREFLLIGRRWDVDLKERLDFTQDGWEESLRKYVSTHGVVPHVWGSDYFVFLRDMTVWNLPPFAIGRMRYDSWLIWRARIFKIPVIDASRVIFCVHQNHPRTYSSIGIQPVSGIDNLRESIEAQRNKELTTNKKCTIHHATHLLTPRFILPRFYARFTALP